MRAGLCNGTDMGRVGARPSCAATVRARHAPSPAETMSDGRHGSGGGGACGTGRSQSQLDERLEAAARAQKDRADKTNKLAEIGQARALDRLAGPADV
jgi:hypothetical protein